MSKESIFLSYAFVGLAACSRFGLLRGRCLQSTPTLALLRLYFFSLIWLPLSQFTKQGSMLMLFYLPFYCDLSEYNGWRISDSFRRSFVGAFLKWILNTKMVSSSEINEQCIVGLHPHGIIPLGTIVNVASEASDFSKLFPSLSKSRIVIAASSCFLVPGFRDLLVTSGVLDCSRFNVEKWLQKGYSVFVVPGGAREGLYSNPDIDWLDLRRKLGFIRLAIQYNVAVVPAYTFNEVDYCAQIPYHDIARWPAVRFVRRKFQQIFGISLPLIYSISLPLSRINGITTVVGEPIRFPHIEDPTDDQVHECLVMYIRKLQKLYDEYAPVYNSRPRPLVIS